jgi:hypothetical protein
MFLQIKLYIWTERENKFRCGAFMLLLCACGEFNKSKQLKDLEPLA